MPQFPWQHILVPALIIGLIMLVAGMALVKRWPRVIVGVEKTADRSKAGIDKTAAGSKNLILAFIRWIDHHRSKKEAFVGPLCDWLVAFGMTPNRQTWLRAGLFIGSITAFAGREYPLAVVLYAVGAPLDITDGATARRYPELVTTHGKFLDPIVDTFSIIGYLVILWSRFDYGWLPWVILTMLIIRIGLYSWYLRFWARKLGKWILPKTVQGEYKALFVGLGLGLMLLSPFNPTIVTEAEFCLILVWVFELQSLITLSVVFRHEVEDFRLQQSSGRTGTNDPYS